MNDGLHAVITPRRVGYHVDLQTDLTGLNSPYWRLTQRGAERLARRKLDAVERRWGEDPRSWTVYP